MITTEKKMDSELKKFVDRAVGLAKVNLKQSGELIPVSFVGKIGGKHGIIGGVFTDENSKDAYADAVKKIAAQTDADFILFISESWTLDPDDAQDFMSNRHKYPTVSSHPRRKEVVMASVETYDGNWLGLAEIIALADGSKTFGEMKWIQSEHTSGRFMKLLF